MIVMNNNLKTIIKEKLISLSDDEYRGFHENLCPGVDNILGVRVPVIRNLGKELLKTYDFSLLYSSIDTHYYEEIMLKGLLIGQSKLSVNEIGTYIEDFVPLINNWAVCDSFSAGLKKVKDNKSLLWDYVLKYIVSSKEFEVRFAIDLIINNYIEEEYLSSVFSLFDKIKLKDYYVEMALAWAISFCFIKYYGETIQYFKKAKLSKFVYNKALQKTCESYRVSNERKNVLREMKI